MEAILASASPPPVSPERSEEMEASSLAVPEEIEEMEASSSLASAPQVSVPPEDTETGKEVHMTFDLNLGDYAQFIRDFRAVLVKNESPEMVAGHLVLAKQLFPEEPKRWMYVKLVGGDNGKETTLVIRDDNLYLMGFQGSNGKWYEFGLSTDATKPMMKKKHATTLLKCDVSYTQLLDVGKDEHAMTKMVTVELGKRSAIRAVGLLSSYGQVDGAVDRDTKLALVCLIHTFCEATRMIPFFNTIVSCWDDTTVTQRIKEDEVMYIWYWGKMSAALREWKEENYRTWGPTTFTTELQAKIGVNSAGEALDVVEVFLRKTRKKPKAKKQENRKNDNDEQAGDGANNGGNEQGGDGYTNDGNRQPGDVHEHTRDSNITDVSAAGGNKQVLLVLPGTGFGQQLVEVFSVRANSRVVGTITVYDGKRGQIIYKYHGPITNYPSTSEGMLDLPLNGPYRSVSADGSFAIRVDSLDESKNAGGRMFWDCYSDKAEYDKFLTQDIGSIAKVSYVVLSNAVEASVKVQLKLHAAARVHGKITAHYKHYSDHCILLFSCTKDEEMELEGPTCDGYINIPIPLQRAVMAVPVGLSLQINVNIHVAFPPYHDNGVYDSQKNLNDNAMVSICDHLILTLEGQERGKLVEGDVDVQVTIGRQTSSRIGVVPKQSDTSPSLAPATTLVPGEGSRRKSWMRWVPGKKTLMSLVPSKSFLSRIRRIK